MQLAVELIPIHGTHFFIQSNHHSQFLGAKTNVAALSPVFKKKKKKASVNACIVRYIVALCHPHTFAQ